MRVGCFSEFLIHIFYNQIASRFLLILLIEIGFFGPLREHVIDERQYSF